MAPDEPIVIAHRGASAYRPEHTLAAYGLAIAMGADFIEPDLVPTSDHRLVARHEPNITDTTDVARRPEFASRRTTKTIDGVEQEGWFAEDFALEELRTLRATERIPAIRPANATLDGLHRIPTFEEIIDLAEEAGVGIYPETKHPTYFASAGLPLEEPLLAALEGRSCPVFIQSFEVANLRELSRRTTLPLVQLASASGQPYDFTAGGDPRTYADITSARGLEEVATYAAGVGPAKSLVVSPSLEPTSLVDDAHRAGLVVHPYTFRPENAFLPAGLRAGDDPAARGDQPAELALFYRLGVDGVFADNPDTAVAVRRRLFRR
jgi:glycerophosphoryl diester phosphodiesterase